MDVEINCCIKWAIQFNYSFCSFGIANARSTNIFCWEHNSWAFFVQEQIVLFCDEVHILCWNYPHGLHRGLLKFTRKSFFSLDKKQIKSWRLGNYLPGTKWGQNSIPLSPSRACYPSLRCHPILCRNADKKSRKNGGYRHFWLVRLLQSWFPPAVIAEKRTSGCKCLEYCFHRVSYWTTLHKVSVPAEITQPGPENLWKFLLSLECCGWRRSQHKVIVILSNK